MAPAFGPSWAGKSLAGTRKDESWRIPKLELLQSVVLSIHLSGAVLQWSADITEHVHVQVIKVPTHSGNNQNYYSQIAHYLDLSEKCFHFDITTYLASRPSNQQDNDELSDQDEDHHPELKLQDHSLTDQMVLTQSVINYFKVADVLSCGRVPNAQKPFCTISTTTTAFHFASKPSL